MAKKRKQGHRPRIPPAPAGRPAPPDQPTARPGPGSTGGAFWKAPTPPAAGSPLPSRRPAPLTGPAALTPRRLAARSARTTAENTSHPGGQRDVSPTTGPRPGHSSNAVPAPPATPPEVTHPLPRSKPPPQDPRTSSAPGRALQSIEDPPSSTRRPFLARRGASANTTVTTLSCGPVDDMHPQSLGVTYWFDTEPSGDPYSVNVYLEGRRHGSDPKKRADFSTVTTVAPVIPGSGPVAITTRLTDVPEGAWDLHAWPVTLVAEEPAQQWAVHDDPLLPVSTVSGRTLYAPVTRVLAPGVVLGAWPALVSLGAVLGVGTQSVLAAQLGLPGWRVALLTVIACLLGLVGAKTYYLATHPHEKRRILTSGMSVQGFVITVGLTLLLGSWALSIPTGPLFDVSAPGLLLGMAVGRLGCLLGGCCVGRPTRSRWGVWSSNRRIGVRRIPVQPLESATALLSCAAAASAVLAVGVSGDGLVFLASLSGYTAARQLLFPLRDLPRATSYGRQIMLVISLVVALAAAGMLLLR